MVNSRMTYKSKFWVNSTRVPLNIFGANSDCCDFFGKHPHPKLPRCTASVIWLPLLLPYIHHFSCRISISASTPLPPYDDLSPPPIITQSPQYFTTLHGPPKGQTNQDEGILVVAWFISVMDLAVSCNTCVGDYWHCYRRHNTFCRRQSSSSQPQSFPTMHGSPKGTIDQDKVIFVVTPCRIVTDLNKRYCSVNLSYLILIHTNLIWYIHNVTTMMLFTVYQCPWKKLLSVVIKIQ